MDTSQNAKEFWGKEVTTANLVWPNESIIKFVKKNISDRNSKILDFGCGAGRNAIALAMEGYQMIAMDYSEEAIKLVEEKANEKLLDIQCVINKNINVPLEKESVNAIVANGSLFYNGWSETIDLLSNLHNILDANGLMWADWRAKEDSLYGMGEKIEDGYFAMNEESGRSGCCYHFWDLAQLEDIYIKSGFKIVSIDKYMYTENNESKKNVWYHVISKK